MSNIFEMIDGFYNCELCESITPRGFCEECQESTCELCLEAYGCDPVMPLHP
jgi:hypothetical protein